MTITATEFKLNMGRYFEIIRESDETILITKNGRMIAELRRPSVTAVQALSELLTDREIKKAVSSDDYRDAVMEEKYGITL